MDLILAFVRTARVERLTLPGQEPAGDRYGFSFRNLGRTMILANE
jgi:hypothetical protein